MEAEKYLDEKKIIVLSLTALISFLWIPSITAIFVVPFHELGHFIGALIEGGAVDTVTFLNVENWISTYFYPLVPEGALGSVTADVPTGSILGLGILPATTIFYFLPYVIGFPISIAMMAGDNIGISNNWRLIGAPMLYGNLVSLPNEYALFTGAEAAAFTMPPIIFKAFYISVIMIGFVGSQFYFLLNDMETK